MPSYTTLAVEHTHTHTHIHTVTSYCDVLNLEVRSYRVYDSQRSYAQRWLTHSHKASRNCIASEHATVELGIAPASTTTNSDLRQSQRNRYSCRYHSGCFAQVWMFW